MTCPHCEYMGYAIRGYKPRPSTKPAGVCPACFGEVPYPYGYDEEVSRYDGAEEPYSYGEGDVG